ncbi:hypothetical protein P0136_10700 [Lentisphaerota bacterium ZTH]|nr:hypothetical protein JYG24_11785 [Lentisphaerota bacterium]WET05830.1 hypothetical protein P0136_10700 [Lentisphaerota bacterium ZTH]
MYETTIDGVIRIADGMYIPVAEENSDYRYYLKWLENGNKPRPIRPSEYHKWDDKNHKYVADEEQSNELCRRLKNEADIKTKQQIIYGFSFKEQKVLLSLERQLNFKVDYDLREKLSYPVKISTKTGYLSFESKEEYAKFYEAVAQHVRTCIETGHKEKDALDEKDAVELIKYLEENFLTKQGVAKCLDNSYTAWN